MADEPRTEHARILVFAERVQARRHAPEVAEREEAFALVEELLGRGETHARRADMVSE